MYSLLRSTLLLALLGFSSCSIARPAWTRHGDIVTRSPRIRWAQLGQPQPGRHTTNRHDGTYSAHHYKRNNLAAHRPTGDDGISVNYPQPGLTHLANYKTPLPGLGPVGGIVFNHRLTTDFGEQNYKMPQAATLRRLNDGRVASKPTIGNSLESLNRQLPVPTPGPSSSTNPTN